MITLEYQNYLYKNSESWKLLLYPIVFKELSIKYRSFYRLRNDPRYSEDEDAQEAFQPFSNILSKINNSPLPYSHDFFEIESLEEKLLYSSLQQTHKDLYNNLLNYCEFFLLLCEHNTNPLLTILEEELLRISYSEKKLSETALLIKRSYLKDVLSEELSKSLGDLEIPKILTHSELVNSKAEYKDVYSFGPFFDLTPSRESRVLLSPKFSSMHIISHNITNNLGLESISLLSENSGFPLAKSFYLPVPSYKNEKAGPSLRILSKELPSQKLTEEEEIDNLESLGRAETEEYLIQEGIKKRGVENNEETLVSAVIFHLTNQNSYLVPDENEIKYIDSDELDAAKGHGETDYNLANISKDKPENISSGDAILIFQGGEGSYVSDLSKKRLGKKYDLIIESQKRWKDELNKKIKLEGLYKVVNDLNLLDLEFSSSNNIKNWSDYNAGGPGQRADFHKLLKYLGIEVNFSTFLENLIIWRREHQKSGRELSRKITKSIKAHDLNSIKENGYSSFEMQGYEGAHVTAHLINSTELMTDIPLSSTKKLIMKSND